MSKPIPNRPQTRIWLRVPGAKPIYGSTNGTTIRPSAVNASISGIRRNIKPPRSCPASRAEQPLRPQDQHERHDRKQHHLGIAWVDHGRQAENLPGDQSTQDRTRKRTDATDDDYDERLDQNCITHVGRQRYNGGIDDTGNPAAIAPMPNTSMNTR